MTLPIHHLGVLDIFVDLICVLSPVNRNKYLENAKEFTIEVKLCQILKLTYFIAEKNRRKKSK
jgi:hypothetical protein